jgi:predicted Zn-dependent protease
MITYGATQNLSEQGLRDCFRETLKRNLDLSEKNLFKFPKLVRPIVRGQYQSPATELLTAEKRQQILAHLVAGTQGARVQPEIISSIGTLHLSREKNLWLCQRGNETAEVEQNFLFWMPTYRAVAQSGSEFQSRSLSTEITRRQQRGLEVFDGTLFKELTQKTAFEALALLRAPNCPSDTRDLILDPDQMFLQIHESIGHPLELDRILGDERNYAGWSFVTLEDFGKLRYGSPLLNVSFDPENSSEFATYGFDDSGNPATKEFLIKDGVLQRALGSLESQVRAAKRAGRAIPGVANFRTRSWNRAPIDRMANINLEGGSTPLANMISSCEKGILMRTNRSWSIDDYRRKFQFGCEYGELIENGKITGVVKNPNYRSSTTDFWMSLAQLGTSAEGYACGTPYCGKGEPNQLIKVGHRSPFCKFAQIEVFGGGK